MLRLEGAFVKVERALSEDALDAVWASVQAVKADAEGPLLRMVSSMMDELHATALDRLRVLWRIKSDFIAESIFDIAEWIGLVDRDLQPLIAELLAKGFETGALRAGVTLPAFDPTQHSREVLEQVLARTRNVGATTLSEIASLIADGLAQNKPLSDIVETVGKLFDGWQAWRPALIVQTASTATFEAGQLDGFEAAGIGTKRWLSERDGRVRRGRFDHDTPDGQEKAMREAFDVSGEKLLHPGDPTGSTGNTINCRCTMLPIAAPASVRTLAPWQRRQQSVKAAYPDLRVEHGQQEALSLLAEQYHCSVSTIKKDLWG